MAHFNLKTAANGEFYFTFHATGNNESMLKSETYKTKASCQSGISSAKENAPYDSRYERKETWNGSQYYFNLNASNGHTLATSEMYNTIYTRNEGIEIVKKQAPGASVYDLT